jgi:hypothetical protein
VSAETRTYLDGNDTPHQHCAPLASLKRWPEAPQARTRGTDVYALSDGDTFVHRLPGMSQSQSDGTVTEVSSCTSHESHRENNSSRHTGICISTIRF